MTDDRKSPFSGLNEGDEEDWDKALNAWEVPDAARPQTKEEAARKPPKPPPPPPKKSPLYRPPAPSTVTPLPPHPDEGLASTFQPYDDDHDEATLVARIPPELLVGAGAASRGDEQGSGLGQVFRRDARRDAPRGAPPPDETGDALLDTLFESPGATPTMSAPDEPSVITSAPNIQVDVRASISDDERKRDHGPRAGGPADDVPEGSLFDPFGPEPVERGDRDERSSTLRPGEPTPDELAEAAPVVMARPQRPPTSPSVPQPLSAPRPPRPPSTEPAPVEPEPPAAPAARPAPTTSRGPSDSGPEFDAAESPSIETLQGGHALPTVASIPPDEDADSLDQTAGRGAVETVEAEKDSVSLLGDPDELATWRARASFIEEEARAAADRAIKARGLLLASELQALAGDEQHAHQLAIEARDHSPHDPLAHRQARTLQVREGDWSAVTLSLQSETRAASTPAARVHDALFAAEVARVALGDKEVASKRLDQASRASPNDPRPYLNRLAHAIGECETLPKIRWPDASELAPLEDACATLIRWRGPGDKEMSFSNPIDALIRARSALVARDPSGTLQALDALGGMTGLAEATGWLGAATSLAYPTDDDAAVARLQRLSEGSLGRLAKRALLAEALRKGSHAEIIAALEQTSSDTFSPQDRVAVGALGGIDLGTLSKWLEPLDRDAGWGTLAAAIRSALGDSQSSVGELGETEETPVAGNPALALARRLGAQADSDQLLRAIRRLEEKNPGSAVAGVLATELDIETGRIDAVGEWLAKTSPEASEETQRDHALAAGLLIELANQPGRARELYETARHADPKCEAAVRAEMGVSPPSERFRILVNHALGLDDAGSGALLLLEAAHGGDGGDTETYTRLLKQAHDRAPSLPFAAWLAERRARARGEFDVIVEWLRERQKGCQDPVEQAYDMVREALLIADSNLESAKELLEQASRARPNDLALRELYERLSPEPPGDKAAFWAERALSSQGPERARLLLFAALEYEKNGEFERAAELAQLSLDTEDSPLARLSTERNEARGERTAHLAERLMERARSSEDLQTRIEAYQRLAELDIHTRADTSSAITWHRSILEERPGFLPSLSRLSQWLIGEGREEELGSVAGEIAKAVEGNEASAHAHLAARLITRAGPWQAGAEFVRIAFSQHEPSLWALREMEAHAAVSDDAATELSVTRRLAEQTSRPLEIATLTLRAAEAAMRTGDLVGARDLLLRAAQAHPTHLVVHRTLGELCERSSDATSAAEAWEAVATLSSVSEHQLEANFRAGIIWLDQAKDAARGRAALEAAAQIDVTYQDVFVRLQGIYVGASDRDALAALLESRLAGVRDPSERIELEVVRGRTLAEMGDVEAAKRALAFALEANPDHAEALAAFADVCAREGDWFGAEQSLIRLVRLVPGTGEQATIYMRLGELYDQHQPNPERAELAYREVLRRLPGDVAAQERLVAVYSRTGDAEKAIEMQQALLQNCTTPESKRKRVIGLAQIYEQVAHDPKRGESMLETARKEFPNDVELLTALAEFYARANRGPAVQVLLDRAAGDARRALSTGRFDVSLFSMLAAVANLRQRGEATRIAEATVAAIEGRPSALAGGDTRAADPRLDDLLAPELLTSAFRSLLYKSGEILDAALPVDLKALRAVPLAQQPGATANELREIAAAYGLSGLEVFVSPTLGSVCMPACAYPPQIVIGQPLLATSDDGVRRFLIRRALKAVQARACAIARSAPIDLAPLISAYLLLFAPDWQPSAVDPAKLHEVHARLLRAKPKRLDDDVPVLALEVIGSLGNRASTLHTVVNNWGNRVALLSSGDLSTGLSAIARAAGHSAGPAANGPERVTWIGRNAEARDLAIFSVSDAYSEVRAKLGLSH